MVHYPSDFPADAARIIVANWRGGKLQTNAAETAEAAWNIAGYGLSASVGQPPSLMQAGPLNFTVDEEGKPIDDEEVLAALESYENGPVEARVLGAAGLSLPLKTLAKWAIQFAFKLLLA